ncbi:penicillin-binding transpeptidase domain-containing protein [Scatolibacter rhodanostii]|uniref:penicillin-binding transpeptidase domain-containing protein n=1 Tax=Scatolibacter rhodanostii TaxID=2014781 RepID=UPI000C0813AD|nr:penicillin-binding transpeptidase domain-containing protein [Scatolibacter rhodanostii]
MKTLFHKLGRTGALVIFVLLIFVLFTVRLFDWQILQGDYYRELASQQNTDFTKLSAVRGEIKDKDGNVLAGNKITYSVNLVYQKMDLTNGFDPNPVLLKIVDLLESRNEEWKDELPIKIDNEGNYIFDEERPKEIEYMKSSAMLNVQSYATPDNCMEALIERYNSGGYSQKRTRALASLRYSMTKNGFGMSAPFTIAGDVSQETVGIINEMLSELPGIQTDVAVTRYYGEDGTLIPHSIGRVGAISENQYNREKEAGNVYDATKGNVEGYTLDDRYGQSGLENAFESDLRGVNGKQVVNLGSDGTVASTVITQSPKAGNTVYTTIDSKLQAVANQSLAEQVSSITEAEGTVTGSVVVLDVKDFGILAASNYPSYDMNRYNTDSAYIEELSEDEVYKPLFNRALYGTYTPGSIFKPAVAAAALQESDINLGTIFLCEGEFKHFSYAGYIPTCMSVHGYESVYTALRDSCNIYFFETGLLLGIDKMQAYAEAFGLGTTTGVELGESEGIMTNPTEYQQNHPGESFTEAITIQAAIGQADNSFTPMQLAAYTATIANNGVRLKTHYLDKVTDYTGTNVVYKHEPEVAADTGVSETTMQAVKEGMRMVAQSGTASTVFGDYGISMGAKTGTAETGNADNLTFIAFAPYDDPEIAVSVVIEHGQKGHNAQNVAKAIFDSYFGLETTEDNENSSTSEEPENTPNESAAEGTASTAPNETNSVKPGAFYEFKKEATFSIKPQENTSSAPPDDEETTAEPEE